MPDAGTRNLWSLVGVVAVAVALLFAASVAGKLASPQATLDVLSDVWRMPTPLATGTFVALCAAEAGLAALLFARPGARLPLLVAAGFVVIVSTSLVLQIVVGSGASCGCGTDGFLDLGKWNPWLGLGRNAAVVTAVLLVR